MVCKSHVEVYDLFCSSHWLTESLLVLHSADWCDSSVLLSSGFVIWLQPVNLFCYYLTTSPYYVRRCGLLLLYRPSSLVCLSVGRSACHTSEPCKNGWTDQDAICAEHSEPHFPQTDIIGAVVIVWRARGKIIRYVLCSIVCNNCTQWTAHTYEQN